MKLSVIDLLEQAVRKCENDCTFESGHDVCWAGRDVYDGLEELVVTKPQQFNQKEAKIAAKMLRDACGVLKRIPQPADEKEAELLKGYIRSTCGRSQEIKILAEEGINAFRKKTVIAIGAF